MHQIGIDWAFVKDNATVDVSALAETMAMVNQKADVSELSFNQEEVGQFLLITKEW